MKEKIMTALFCVFLVGCAKPDFVSVDAAAYRSIYADKATVYFAVEGRGASSKEAVAQCEKLMEKVQSFTPSFESEGRGAEIHNMTVRPVYSYSDGGEEIREYLSRMDVCADMKDTAKTEDFIKGLSEIGIGSVERVVFSLSNKDEIEDSLNKEAMKKARTKATSLCAADGRKVGKILSVEERGNTGMYFLDSAREAAATKGEFNAFESARINLERAFTVRFRIK